jgi:hypothetical protein
LTDYRWAIEKGILFCHYREVPARCADVRHGILDRWDAEILEAQIARIHIMTDEDAPDWTAKQIEALERA